VNTTQLPQVVVLSTGGTIAGSGASTMSLTEYKPGALLGTQLVEAVPELMQFASVRVEQVCNIASPDISIAVWRQLAGRINAIFAGEPEVAGIVITHGTSTIEETAYFLNLTVRHERPVVLTGSQRPPSALSADGPLNLVNAVRAAAAPASRGRGVLVLLNDEINAARDVTKSNTYRAETFRSGELGFLGYVDQDRVAYYRAPDKRHTIHSEFDVAGIGEFPKVDVLYAYAESSNAMLMEALQRAGVQGIVLACTGAGTLAASEKEVIRRMSQLQPDKRPVFVRSSRVGNGRVIGRNEYDDLGMVAADNLSAQKARILLMLALTRTRDIAEIRRIFAEY
jgi:L-asparaginase